MASRKIPLLLCCAAYAMAVGHAQAQTASSSLPTAPGTSVAPQPVAIATQAGAQETEASADIVVTGSRIARRDYSSESPIVTVGSDAIASTGATTLEQGLNQLPQITTSASSAANFNSRAGQANVNLRGLGQQRTLVLVDGRRVQPSGADGSVDLNTLPPTLIDNIEVITGGASSTYGSDAVAGVVNVKLKKRFHGVQIDATTGSTFVGDADNSSIGITAGTDFADQRGNVYFSASYADRGGADFLSRDYLAGQVYSTNTPGGLITAVASNLPSQAAVTSVFSRYGVTSTVARTSTFSVNADGTLYVGTGAINYRGPRTSPFTVYTGNVYSVAGDSFLAQVPLTRYNIIGRAEYRITDSLTLFTSGLYTHYTATTQGPPLTVGSVSSLPISVPVTNPFISADLRTILASRPNPNAPFLLAQQVLTAGNRNERNRYDVYQLTAGLDGRVAGTDITWNVYASQGETKLAQTELNYLSSLAVQRLLNAADGGASICAGGYNFTNVNSLSPACLAYIGRSARNDTKLRQTVVEANAQGGLLALPAGDVRFAVGADYRRNSYAFSPDPLISSGELANYLPIFASAGSESVKEVYGELLLPLIRNAFFAREINLNLGYRRSEYRVSGGINTYKADADWAVTRWLRLRGGYARSVRAPSVGDLYTATSNGLFALGAPGSLGSGDPCDVRGAYRTGSNAAAVRALCIAQGVPTSQVDTFTNTVSRTPFTTSGNLDLDPETSDTLSGGVVLRSNSTNPLFAKFTASVDYFNISLHKAIGVVTNTVATSECFNASGNTGLTNSNYYCSLITRDPNTGLISNIGNPTLNLGGYKTSGIDFAIDWTIPLDAVGIGANSGNLTLASVFTYLDRFEIQTLAGGPTLDYAGTIGNQQVDFFGTAKPRWKGTSSIGYGRGGFQGSFRWRYLDAMSNARNVGTGGTLHGVTAVSYFDLDLSAQVSKNLDLRAGIVNLFDKKPPTLNDSLIGSYATDPYTYDLIGRRFYVTIKARL